MCSNYGLLDNLMVTLICVLIIKAILFPLRYSNCRCWDTFNGIGEVERIGFMDTSWLLLIKINNKNHRFEISFFNGIEDAAFLNTSQIVPFASIKYNSI